MVLGTAVTEKSQPEMAGLIGQLETVAMGLSGRTSGILQSLSPPPSPPDGVAAQEPGPAGYVARLRSILGVLTGVDAMLGNIQEIL